MRIEIIFGFGEANKIGKVNKPENVEPYAWLDPFWDENPAENAEENPGGILLDPSWDENPELNPRDGFDPA